MRATPTSALHCWLLLVLTLPTENATARMRAWRGLKAMGCAVLRDGVYLLPHSDERRQTLLGLADGVIEAGGSAHVIEHLARDRSQDQSFRGLFDRGEDYAELTRSLTAARKALANGSAAEAHRALRRLRRDFESLGAIDFFPGDAALRAEAAWSQFLEFANKVLSPDEPHVADEPIRRLNLKEYQGRTWATRRHLWVDRVASAWLIRRFIDPKAKFAWLGKPDDCPKAALGFDFDGAGFTHVGERVTFEVLLASFGLEKDRGLTRLGDLVHSLDVGGIAIPEAGGFEALMAGARKQGLSDDALLEQMQPALDFLYAYYSESKKGRRR